MDTSKDDTSSSNNIETPRKVTPGWNDPPVLNYTDSNPPPKSRLTNKRIPFPTSINEISRQPAEIQNPKQTPGNSATPETSVLLFDVNQELYERTKGRVTLLIENKKQSNDVRVKSNVMLELWKGGRFPKDLQENLDRILHLLLSEDRSEVNKLQLDILMKHGSICNSWISILNELNK